MSNLSTPHTYQKPASEQVSIEEINDREIHLPFVLIAHQLVLFPLYFFLPFWIFIFNSMVLLVVYFSKIKKIFRVVQGLKVLITLIALAGVLLSFHRIAGRDAGVSLIAIMYGLKIIEIESKRDVYIVMLLGFFLLLASFLFSSSPLIASYQFIPVLAILYALQSMHAISPYAQYKRNVGVGNNQSIFNVIFNSSTKFLLKQLLKYLALALPIMLLLFLFFPRLSGPIWKMPGQKNATSGISETMSPGAISSLHLSDEIAFRVEFDGKEPKGNELYWRTLVLDSFDGLTWSHTNPFKSNRWIKEDKKPFQKVSFLNENQSSNTVKINSVKINYRYEIALEATQQKWLTLLDKPSRVISIAKVLNDFSVSTRRKIFTRIKYRAESQINLLLDYDLTEQTRNLNTRLPKGYNPRSISWAKNNRLNAGTDEQYIQSILQSINKKEYFYTLSPPIMDENTVDSFWFDEQKGFCEHYAGALVFLARAADIPARVVIGYQGAEKNILSDYWIVRHSNAHAWTEIWFSGKGWVRVDPTAAIAKHRIEEQLLTDYSQRNSLFDSFNFNQAELDEIGFSKQFGFWLDQLDSGWNDWFLEYNQILQQKLMMNLGLDRFSREQIALLSLFLILGFMLLVNIRWGANNENISITSKAIDLLKIKLLKYKITLPSNDGMSQFISHLKLKNRTKHGSLNKQKLSQKSIRELEVLLQHYQIMRYAQNNCSLDQQKAFYKRVKKLKLTRFTV